MRSRRAKVLHEIAHRPMIGHVAAAAAALKPARLALVVAPGADDVVAAARVAAPRVSIVPAVQRDRRGTGHAMLQTRKALAGHRGDVLILLGDAPLIRPETLRRLIEARRKANAAVAVLGMRLAAPGAYGRLVTGDGDALERIVEARDLAEHERDIDLCNSGVMAVDGAVLFELLRKIRPDNAKGEYYVTDLVGLARAAGRDCVWAEGAADELIAINNRVELAQAEAALQQRLREAAMTGGATLVDPASVFLAWDTKLGADVWVGPSVTFGLGVTVEDDVTINAYCHLAGAVVRSGAIVGPFARLRPGAEISAGAHVGNYVEIKNARLGRGAKANHLAYIGDANVGAGANIGAGTITCNYDGAAKHRTEIGAGSFIGSNATLVAPVSVGDRAFVAAGSTVTANVPADALAFGRARQETLRGAGKALMARLSAAKAKTKTGKKR